MLAFGVQHKHVCVSFFFKKKTKELLIEAEEVKTITKGVIPIPKWGRIPTDPDWESYDTYNPFELHKDGAELR